MKKIYIQPVIDIEAMENESILLPNSPHVVGVDFTGKTVIPQYQATAGDGSDFAKQRTKFYSSYDDDESDY